MGTEATIYHLPGFHEPFSAMSHLFGAVLFLGLGCMLLRYAWGNTPRLIYSGVYAFACVLLFSMSGVYHMMERGGTARAVMERLDHGAIFILIAGTFTPVHGLLFRGWRRWFPLVFIWSVAVAGIVLKTIFFHEVPRWFGLSLYIGMGWVGTITGVALARRFGFAFIAPLLLGGVAYTVGGLIDQLGWTVVVPGVVHPHELFHLAVLMGAFIHWLFVWKIVEGHRLRHPGAAAMPDHRGKPHFDLSASSVGKDVLQVLP